MKKVFKKHIFLPQDHGSWVFILSPLLVGVFAGGSFTGASIHLDIVAMAAFLIRQPVSILVKIYSGRRARDDLAAAYLWAVVYSLFIALALLGLVRGGFGFLVYLSAPGLLMFAWHLWLLSRSAERRKIGVEVVATGVLSLAAPTAYWVGIGEYHIQGWWLWALVWLQSAASIVYAYLRLAQREWKVEPSQIEKWRQGTRALAYTTFNVMFSLALVMFISLPKWIFIPYLLQWLETLWGITHPAIGWKPTRIGIRQLAVSSLWTILFIVTWRLNIR